MQSWECLDIFLWTLILGRSFSPRGWWHTEQVAQGGCWCPIPGSIQGQAGCGSGQPGLLVGDPAHSRRVGTGWALWSFLWLCDDSMTLWSTTRDRKCSWKDVLNSAWLFFRSKSMPMQQVSSYHLYSTAGSRAGPFLRWSQRSWYIIYPLFSIIHLHFIL